MYERIPHKPIVVWDFGFNYDKIRKKMITRPGNYELQIGASSSDIRATVDVIVQ